MSSRAVRTERCHSLGVAAIYWLLLAVVNAAARGVFMVVLYRYATKQEVSAGFNLHDLSRAWQPKAL